MRLTDLREVRELVLRLAELPKSGVGEPKNIHCWPLGFNTILRPGCAHVFSIPGRVAAFVVLEVTNEDPAVAEALPPLLSRVVSDTYDFIFSQPCNGQVCVHLTGVNTSNEKGCLRKCAGQTMETSETLKGTQAVAHAHA